jgi:anthranilate synthase component 2
MRKILVLDNYDSFTYNLIHYVKELTSDQVAVFRNDKISLTDVEQYDKILLSPGPGIPSEAGIMPELLRIYGANKSIFGVCLGQQCIAEVYGGTIVNLDSVYHGVESEINIVDDTELLFNGLPKTFMAGRYHSWNVESNTLPACLKVTAVDNQGMVMAISHISHDVRGVQFHPESVLTPLGKQMIKNWLMC